MNTRKPTDYSAMYGTLDQLMGAELPQMELYFAIGRAVCAHLEKGAAVMAAEYLQENYLEAKGFSLETCAGCGNSTGPMQTTKSRCRWP